MLERANAAYALAFANDRWRMLSIVSTCTIYGRFNVAYGAPAPREGVRRREGGTLGAGGYTRVLPPRGYRANPNPDHNPNPMALT